MQHISISEARQAVARLGAIAILMVIFQHIWYNWTIRRGGVGGSYRMAADIKSFHGLVGALLGSARDLFVFMFIVSSTPFAHPFLSFTDLV